MRPSQIILLAVAALLVSASAFSATLETTETKPLLNHYATPVRHEVYSGRSLRSDENDGAINEKESISTEERGNPLSRFETHGMWSDARRYVTTFRVRQGMERSLGKRIETASDLDAIRGSNGFRVYKRYANIFDDNIINIMGSGYYNPRNFGNDPKAAHMEKMTRAEIWGESKRDVLRVKEWLELERAKKEELTKNEYFQQYVKAFNGQVRRPTEAEDINALKAVILS